MRLPRGRRPTTAPRTRAGRRSRRARPMQQTIESAAVDGAAGVCAHRRGGRTDGACGNARGQVIAFDAGIEPSESPSTTTGGAAPLARTLCSVNAVLPRTSCCARWTSPTLASTAPRRRRSARLSDTASGTPRRRLALRARGRSWHVRDRSTTRRCATRPCASSATGLHELPGPTTTPSSERARGAQRAPLRDDEVLGVLSSRRTRSRAHGAQRRRLLVEIGRGRLPVSSAATLLEAGDRCPLLPAPPQGLCLRMGALSMKVDVAQEVRPGEADGHRDARTRTAAAGA